MRRFYFSTALFLFCSFLYAQTPVTTESVPQEDQTIHSTVQNVLLDVTVLDKNNKPVTSLGKEHFTIFEDGKPQQLASFEEMGTKPYVPPPALNLPPHVYSNIPSIGASASLYVLVMDSLNTAIKDQMYMRQQMLEFLKKLPQGSRIAIFGLSNRLYILQGFTSDPAALQEALKNKKSWAKSSILMDDPDVESMSDMMSDMSGSTEATANMAAFMDSVTNFQNEQRIQNTMDAFNSLALYLSVMDGRKNVIWFAGNFPLNMFPDMSQANPFDAISVHGNDWLNAAGLMAAQRISFYPVDARGLTTPAVFSASRSGAGLARNPNAMNQALSKEFASDFNTHTAMEDLAGLTGGKAFYNRNDLNHVLDSVMEIGRNYYSLSYAPPHTKYDDAFHKIRVKLDIPGYKLLYRNGYFASDPAHLAGRQTQLNPDPMLASLMRGTPDTTQIPFKIRVLPADPQPDMSKSEERRGELSTGFKNVPARFVADWAIDVHSIRFTRSSSGVYAANIRMVLAANDADGRLLNAVDNNVKIQTDKQHYDFYSAHGLQFHQEIDLPKGEVFLRTAVVDLANNHSGATEIPLLVNPTPKKKNAATTPAPAQETKKP
jgi:VWFA-related protein